jgi:hypothetical protein
MNPHRPQKAPTLADELINFVRKTETASHGVSRRAAPQADLDEVRRETEQAAVRVVEAVTKRRGAR